MARKRDVTELITPAWPEPDPGAYPWAGLLRCLVWAHRLQLPHLVNMAQEQIRREAQRCDQADRAAAFLGGDYAKQAQQSTPGNAGNT